MKVRDLILKAYNINFFDIYEIDCAKHNRYYRGVEGTILARIPEFLLLQDVLMFDITSEGVLLIYVP